MHREEAARRISWGSYLFQFWISGADFVQEGDQPSAALHFNGWETNRREKREGFQSLFR